VSFLICSRILVSFPFVFLPLEKPSHRLKEISSYSSHSITTSSNVTPSPPPPRNSALNPLFLDSPPCILHLPVPKYPPLQYTPPTPLNKRHPRPVLHSRTNVHLPTYLACHPTKHPPIHNLHAPEMGHTARRLRAGYRRIYRYSPGRKAGAANHPENHTQDAAAARSGYHA